MFFDLTWKKKFVPGNEGGGAGGGGPPCPPFSTALKYEHIFKGNWS